MEKSHKIGLGLAALGRPSYINLGHCKDITQTSKSIMEQKTHAMLNIAWEQGVRYFDTARSYGLAEKFLSTWLEKNPVRAKQSIISSKWGYIYTANWNKHADIHEIKDHSEENLSNQWRETSALLREHLDVYLIHSATFDSGVLDDISVLEKLHKLKDQGIRIGASISGEQQSALLDYAMNITVNDAPLFNAYQATFNILETSATTQLQKAHNQGALIIAKECLANGLLTTRNTFKDSSYIEHLHNMASQYSASIDALSMAFVAQQDFVDIALSGASTGSQLQSNLTANDLPLSAKSIENLFKLSQPPRQYWNNRSKLPWN